MIDCILGNFSKPLATISSPKLPTLLGNFSKVVEIFHFASEIIFGQLLLTFGDFLLVTLSMSGMGKQLSVILSEGASERLSKFVSVT